MIDPLRQEIFECISRVLEMTPDVRVGQVICNAMGHVTREPCPSIGNVDDEELLEALKLQIEGMEPFYREKREMALSKAG